MKPCRGSNKLGIASELNPGFTKKEQNEKEWSINKRIRERIIKEESKNWEGDKGNGTLTLVELGSSWGGRGERNRSRKKEKDASFVCVVPTNSVYWELRQRRKWREEKEVERGKRKTQIRGKEREDKKAEKSRERGKKHDQCAAQCEREKITITRKSQLTAVMREKKQKKV